MGNRISKVKKKPKPSSQRDKGYSNILHHLSKGKIAQGKHNKNIERLLKQIMATQDEEAGKLNALSTQLQKANDEIQKAIQDLKDALAAGGNTSPAVDAATDALTAKAQALDDIVPDAP